MKGFYVLIIENRKDIELEIGKLGCVAFEKSFYAYVGSALSGLERRIERHLRDPGDNKKLHWHIDYFLASPTVEIIAVVFAKSVDSKECEIATNLNRDLAAITDFGCTDCRCPSHLFFSTSLSRLKELVHTSFYGLGVELYSMVFYQQN